MFDVVGDKKNYQISNIQYNTKKKELNKISKIVQKAENTGYNINKNVVKIPPHSSLQEITKKVLNGEILLEANREHYEKHIYGTKQYRQY
ncbi:MAG: hypothetical protein Q4E02_00825 [Lagierella massiliensis]|nr:hypothetical protein [Lagierella massiliensis]